jgi:hypothetical protein
VFVKEDVPEYHMRKAISRKLTQCALKFLFLRFPGASTAHETDIQKACSPSQHLRTQAMRSATRSVFREHRHKRLDIEAASRAMQRQVAVLATAP